MSFFSTLFGRGKSAPETKLSDPVEYKGFVIRAAPYKNNSHYQTAGVIARDIGGERKEHRFIRADFMPHMTMQSLSPSTRRARSSICRASGFSTPSRAQEIIRSGDDESSG